MYVVPEPSERCATVTSVSGSLTPGFSFAIAGSFHFVIFPRMSSARTGAGELELARHARDVVDRHDAAEHGRQVEDRSRRPLQLVVGHRPVARAEEDRLARQLLDAAARADRLVVDLDVGVDLVVLGEPLRVDRVREGGAGAVDLDRSAPRASAAAANPSESPNRNFIDFMRYLLRPGKMKLAA